MCWIILFHLVIPLLVAMMSIGDMSLSRARFRKEKHSTSSMCTSSIKRTYIDQTRQEDTSLTMDMTGMTYSRDYFSLPFFPPFSHLGINLISDFPFDLPCRDTQVYSPPLVRDRKEVCVCVCVCVHAPVSPEKRARNP